MLSATLVFIGAYLLQASAQYALTEEEIQILRDNDYTITIDEGNNIITYEHHGLPGHTSDRGWGNPNEAEMVNHSFTLPLKATVASVKGCAGGLGSVGIAVDGGAFYNPYTIFGWNAVEGECPEDFDNCGGHPSPNGEYHYHGVPHCLYTGDLRDKFLGVAHDGYPIYGAMDSTGKNWTSSELDICHGHTYNGRYMYRITYDFPYIISCFRGEDVKTQRQKRALVNNTDDSSSNQRNRRHIVNHGVFRRQIPIPPGLENDPCWNAKYTDWETRICRVVCENAGQDLDNCQTNVENSATMVFYSVAIVYYVMLTFSMIIFN